MAPVDVVNVKEEVEIPKDQLQSVGGWKRSLRKFMHEDGNLNEVIALFAQKFTMLGESRNFTLTTLTDLAWTVCMMTWEAVLEGKLPMAGAIDAGLRERYEGLKQQFHSTRAAWLREITTLRDARRAASESASAQETLDAVHDLRSDEIFYLLPENTIETDTRPYFKEAVQETLKMMLLKRGAVTSEEARILEEEIKRLEHLCVTLQKKAVDLQIDRDRMAREILEHRASSEKKDRQATEAQVSRTNLANQDAATMKGLEQDRAVLDRKLRLFRDRLRDCGEDTSSETEDMYAKGGHKQQRPLSRSEQLEHLKKEYTNLTQAKKTLLKEKDELTEQLDDANQQLQEFRRREEHLAQQEAAFHEEKKAHTTRQVSASQAVAEEMDSFRQQVADLTERLSVKEAEARQAHMVPGLQIELAKLQKQVTDLQADSEKSQARLKAAMKEAELARSQAAEAEAAMLEAEARPATGTSEGKSSAPMSRDSTRPLGKAGSEGRAAAKGAARRFSRANDRGKTAPAERPPPAGGSKPGTAASAVSKPSTSGTSGTDASSAGLGGEQGEVEVTVSFANESESYPVETDAPAADASSAAAAEGAEADAHAADASEDQGASAKMAPSASMKSGARRVVVKAKTVGKLAAAQKRMTRSQSEKSPRPPSQAADKVSALAPRRSAAFLEGGSLVEMTDAAVQSDLPFLQQQSGAGVDSAEMAVQTSAGDTSSVASRSESFAVSEPSGRASPEQRNSIAVAAEAEAAGDALAEAEVKAEEAPQEADTNEAVQGSSSSSSVRQSADVVLEEQQQEHQSEASASLPQARQLISDDVGDEDKARANRASLDEDAASAKKQVAVPAAADSASAASTVAAVASALKRHIKASSQQGGMSGQSSSNAKQSDRKSSVLSRVSSSSQAPQPQTQSTADLSLQALQEAHQQDVTRLKKELTSSAGREQELQIELRDLGEEVSDLRVELMNGQSREKGLQKKVQGCHEQISELKEELVEVRGEKETLEVLLAEMQEKLAELGFDQEAHDAALATALAAGEVASAKAKEEGGGAAEAGAAQEVEQLYTDAVARARHLVDRDAAVWDREAQRFEQQPPQVNREASSRLSEAARRMSKAIDAVSATVSRLSSKEPTAAAAAAEQQVLALEGQAGGHLNLDGLSLEEQQRHGAATLGLPPPAGAAVGIAGRVVSTVLEVDEENLGSTTMLSPTGKTADSCGGASGLLNLTHCPQCGFDLTGLLQPDLGQSQGSLPPTLLDAAAAASMGRAASDPTGVRRLRPLQLQHPVRQLIVASTTDASPKDGTSTADASPASIPHSRSQRRNSTSRKTGSFNKRTGSKQTSSHAKTSGGAGLARETSSQIGGKPVKSAGRSHSKESKEMERRSSFSGKRRDSKLARTSSTGRSGQEGASFTSAAQEGASFRSVASEVSPFASEVVHQNLDDELQKGPEHATEQAQEGRKDSSATSSGFGDDDDEVKAREMDTSRANAHEAAPESSEVIGASGTATADASRRSEHPQGASDSAADSAATKEASLPSAEEWSQQQTSSAGDALMEARRSLQESSHAEMDGKDATAAGSKKQEVRKLRPQTEGVLPGASSLTELRTASQGVQRMHGSLTAPRAHSSPTQTAAAAATAPTTAAGNLRHVVGARGAGNLELCPRTPSREHRRREGSKLSPLPSSASVSKLSTAGLQAPRISPEPRAIVKAPPVLSKSTPELSLPPLKVPGGTGSPREKLGMQHATAGAATAKRKIEPAYFPFDTELDLRVGRPPSSAQVPVRCHSAPTTRGGGGHALAAFVTTRGRGLRQSPQGRFLEGVRGQSLSPERRDPQDMFPLLQEQGTAFAFPNRPTSVPAGFLRAHSRDSSSSPRIGRSIVDVGIPGVCLNLPMIGGQNASSQRSISPELSHTQRPSLVHVLPHVSPQPSVDSSTASIQRAGIPGKRTRSPPQPQKSGSPYTNPSPTRARAISPLGKATRWKVAPVGQESYLSGSQVGRGPSRGTLHTSTPAASCKLQHACKSSGREKDVIMVSGVTVRAAGRSG